MGINIADSSLRGRMSSVVTRQMGVFTLSVDQLG